MSFRQLIKRTMTRSLPRGAFVTEATGRRVCLTFDDGPDPEVTPALLDVLAAHDIQATFFVIGMHAAWYPEIVRRIADEGHAIGTHSYTHGSPERTSAKQLAQETRRAGEIIASITGSSPRLVRPPFGTLSASKTLALWALRQTIVLWNVDPRDYACRRPAELASRLPAPEPGDVVLLHDRFPYAAAVLPDYARACRDRGLAFSRVDA